MSDGVTLSGDWRKLNQKLSKMVAEGTFKKMHVRISEALLDDSMQSFRDSTSPAGTEWPDLSAATKAKRRGGRPKKLVDSRRLQRSITRRATIDQAEVGTNVEYAAIHQFGGEAGRRASRVKIPARPYLGIGKGTEEEVETIIREELL